MLDPDATVLDALVDLAVRFCREHSFRVNERHIRAAVAWIGNERAFAFNGPVSLVEATLRRGAARHYIVRIATRHFGGAFDRIP